MALMLGPMLGTDAGTDAVARCCSMLSGLMIE